MYDDDYWRRRLENKVKLIESSTTIKRLPKTAILGTIDLWLSQGILRRRVLRICDVLYSWARICPGMANPTEKDFISGMSKLHSIGYTPETIESSKNVLRKFYRHYEHGAYIELAHPFLRSHKCPPAVRSEDLITDSEFRALLGACKDVWFKAFLEVLRYGGFRVSEAVSMRKKNISWSTMAIDGKLIRLVYLSCNESKTIPRKFPTLDNMENLKKLCSTLKDDDFLFKQYDGGNRWYYILLREACRRAGIERRIWFHLFRHTRNSELECMNTPRSVRCWVFGWSPTSKQPERYGHLSTSNMEKLLIEPMIHN